ncbi:MAG: hypothetical protein IPM42_17315 [Saprospiraceae bacterium]|nr:hypothetical protein [Saprospiraceae bacterium]
MKQLLNIFFISFVLLGFSATLVNQYQQIKVAISVLEENHENSGESESLLSDSSNSAKILSSSGLLEFLFSDLRLDSQFFNQSKIIDLITGSDHFSPPEQRA